MDALVRAGCERMRARVEQARKRHCATSLVRAASESAVAGAPQEEVQLEAARRRAAALEERLRQVAAESQAWCGLARSNEAVAAGPRAAPTPVPAEGSGESDDFASPTPFAAADDAQSCCFVAKDAHANEDAARSPAGKWACKNTCVVARSPTEVSQI